MTSITEMASASTQRLENLLECPICLKKVNDPRAFDCHHFYCQPCINDLPPKRDGGSIGYHCPMCRQFTAKDKLKTIHFLHELLEILDLTKKEQQQVCGMCKETVAEFKCIDCKDAFCPNCKEQHNRVPILKNHEWEPIDFVKSNVVDRHIYCTQHPKEVVKFNCKECEKLICMICNGTQHKQHTAETIEEAVERVLSIVQQQKENVEKILKQNKDTLAMAISDAENAEKQYGNVEEEIDKQCEEIIKNAKKDKEKLKKQLQHTKKQQLDEIKEWIKKSEVNVKSQEQVVALSDTTVAANQHASLLQALQSNVRKGFENVLNGTSEQPLCNPRMTTKFIPSPVSQSNVIGSLSTSTVTTQPLFNNLPLSQIRFLAPRLHKNVNIGFICARFTKICNDLWCIEHRTNNVHVYDEHFNKHKIISFSDIGTCRSIAKVGSNIMVAASKGLYQTKLDGSEPCIITDGDMSDACWMGNMGYVLDNGNAKVHVVKFDAPTNKATNEKDIPLITYRYDKRNTIQVTQEYIAIATVSGHNILKYSHDGVLISSHGLRGGATGQLLTPWLCGADKDGALLVAEEGNKRLQILEPDGTWHRLNVKDIKYPYCAMIDNCLIVTHGGDISRFLMQ